MDLSSLMTLLPSGEEGGEERKQCSRACCLTALGPAVARSLLASETCTFAHTFPQSCQNASVQSQPPREKVRMHLNYFPQKISKMFNCSKSILITTRWISDGNLLSFLPAYLPSGSHGKPEGAAETPISWEVYQAHSQRSCLWLWLPDSPADQFPRH